MEEAARWRARGQVRDDQAPGLRRAGKIIAQKTGGTTQPRADERIVTLAWFTRNRFFPLREGSTWKEATAETHKSAIEQGILATFGDLSLAQIDKVMLQMHLNKRLHATDRGGREADA